MTTTGTTSGSVTKERIVPLISSDTAGPLGAIHVPRLWAKLTLAASGRLAEGYDECGPGFDQMTLDDMKIDRHAAMTFVREKKPTYMQFEQWIIEQNGGSIDPQRIKAHNEAVRAYCHKDELATEMRTASGIPHQHIKDAVTLNTIEDLDELYKQATRT
jgi:hypothetical protein